MPNLTPAEAFNNADAAFDREFAGMPQYLNDARMRLIFIRGYLNA